MARDTVGNMCNRTVVRLGSSGFSNTDDGKHEGKDELCTTVKQLLAEYVTINAVNNNNDNNIILIISE
jgi:hypothetical protein